MKFHKFAACAAVVFLFCLQAQAKECQENQGAMDFGSGTTKILALQVDVCEKKILKVLFEDRLPLAFNEAYEKSSDKKIPEKFWQGTVPVIQASLNKLRAQDVKKIHAVATAVFRNAKNGQDVIHRFNKELNLKIQIITQDQEAELGFWSVLAAKNIFAQTEPVFVWDIGGGSMQMFGYSNGKSQVFRGHLASVSFKNEILKVLQFKNPESVSSPNPLGRNREAAIQLAKNHAALNVPKFFKDRSQKTQWIGIGGVLAMSVQKQVKKGENHFSQDELAATLQVRSQFDDAQLDGDYKVSDVSNLALVLGYMRALKIENIETIPASLGQGLVYKNLNSK